MKKKKLEIDNNKINIVEPYKVEPFIIQNAIQVNGKYLISKHVHDCQQWEIKGKNGKLYYFMVDGGREYFRFSQPNLKSTTRKRYGIKYKNLMLTNDNHYEEILDKFLVFVVNKKLIEDIVRLKDCDICFLESRIDQIKSTLENRFSKFLIDLFYYRICELDEERNKLKLKTEHGIKFTEDIYKG